MPALSIENNVLVYQGCNFLKQRLILSTLSGKPVRIIDIRPLDSNPGLQEFEINLIRLFDKITNGTTIELSPSGTSLYFQPGLLNGGSLEHDCCVQRGIGYYLEVLLCLGPFCKKPINAILRGVTNCKIDPSVDQIKTSALSILKRFLIVDDGLSMKITKRGLMPLGGGEVRFTCPLRKQLRPIQFTDPGKVKRIRGNAYVTRMTPAISNRIVETAKGVLLNFLPDVYINTDPYKGKDAGKSSGFGVYLAAETTNGVFYSGEQVSNVITEGEDPTIPEDLGTACGQKLLEEIYRGGCCDSAFQYIVILFMTLGQKDVSKFVFGPLSEYSIAFLQHIREFFGLIFNCQHVDDGENDNINMGAQKVELTCVGIGFTNLSKRVL